MEKTGVFTDEDIRQIEAHGLTAAEAFRQLALFEGPAPHLDLLRPCTPGDGIRVMDPADATRFAGIYDREGADHQCLKFVPASGAASRMFRTLLSFIKGERDIIRQGVADLAEKGDSAARELLAFMDGIRRFAFFDDLKGVMSKAGLDAEALAEEGRFTDVIRFLLYPEGLNYAALPKGLLKFHAYPRESRTAFEEHLVEGADYVKGPGGESRLHFTVSPEHMDGFRRLLETVRPVYGQRFQTVFNVSFSVQKPATDTLAVDLSNRPFRQDDGTLLLRPGGHGALLENLKDLDGDIVFIKNIDNVVPDRLKAETSRWKKVLGGYFLHVRSGVFRVLQGLSSGPADAAAADRAVAFIERELGLPVPEGIRTRPPEEKRAYVVKALNRPIRVCGMVKNEGEPGGGPFWVREPDGRISLQIVETAQVDPESARQQEILRRATHFNPVDLVCGLRDYRGKPFDLDVFVDPTAVFISRKSKEGRELKALEHPGLWNGAMSGWLTLFVEVPIVTFNPVKTVNDLLRPAHQPA